MWLRIDLCSSSASASDAGCHLQPQSTMAALEGYRGSDASTRALGQHWRHMAHFSVQTTASQASAAAAASLLKDLLYERLLRQAQVRRRLQLLQKQVCERMSRSRCRGE